MEACQSKCETMSSRIQELLTGDLQNLAFAKDEAKFSMKKLKHKFTGDLGGREPDVETET